MTIAPLEHIEVGVDPKLRSLGLATGTHVIVFSVEESGLEVDGVFYSESWRRFVVNKLIRVDDEWRFKHEDSPGMRVDGISAYEPAIGKLQRVLAEVGHSKFQPKHSR